jgi:hypothetical protein
MHLSIRDNNCVSIANKPIQGDAVHDPAYYRASYKILNIQIMLKIIIIKTFGNSIHSNVAGVCYSEIMFRNNSLLNAVVFQTRPCNNIF